MQQTRDLAITLRWSPYEERHRVVTALTENHGRVSGLARNSIQSRRFGGALEPFSAALWHFVERPGADLVRIEEAHIRRSFEGLRKDFQRLSLASVFNELMLKLAPEREPCPDLFRLHANALATLEELPSGTPADGWSEVALLNAYMSKVLQWSGTQPQIQVCLGCQTPASSLQDGSQLHCHVADAGWFCVRCRATATGGGTRHVQGREGQNFQQLFISVSPAALQDLEIAMSSPIKGVLPKLRASLPEQRQLFAFVEALFVYHLPGFDRAQLKSLRFLGLESQVPWAQAPRL